MSLTISARQLALDPKIGLVFLRARPQSSSQAEELQRDQVQVAVEILADLLPDQFRNEIQMISSLKPWYELGPYEPPAALQLLGPTEAARQEKTLPQQAIEHIGLTAETLKESIWSGSHVPDHVVLLTKLLLQAHACVQYRTSG